VNVAKAGYSNDSEEVTVVAGAITWLNFSLTAVAGNVIGHVVDSEDGTGMKDVVVEMMVAGDEKTYITGATGYFEFNLVPAGDYTITASRSGYTTNSTSVTVVGGETTTTEIQLEKEESGGISTTTIAVIGVLAAAAIAAVAISLLKRRRGEAPPSSEGDAEPPPLE
jgi:hypothetical protein